MKISIGICTYKRPIMLEKCLESIYNLKVPHNIDVDIILVDNDPSGSAQNIAVKYIENSRIPVHYGVETQRGIPFARNNVLDNAKRNNTDLLAFIDDDEYADPDWLKILHEYFLFSNCDVVRGYVKTSYPSDVPGWVVRGNYYQRKNRETGVVLTSGATGNVLFNFKKLCVDWNIRFDENFGLQGGSDSDFFRRAYLLGAKITWVSNAVVYETLDKERYKVSYLLKRKFRTRNGRTYFKNLSTLKWIKTFFSSIKRIVKGFILLPLALINGPDRIISSLCEISAGMGRLLGLFKIHIEWNEYSVK